MTGRLRISAPATDTAPVLLVSPDPADSRYMREILATLGGRLVSASDLNSAKKSLGGGDFGVVITERDLPDGDWLDLLFSLQCLDAPPLLIVVSRLADEHLWVEVLNRSGFDVLPKPFVRAEAYRVLEHALKTWAEMVPKRPVCSESGPRLGRRSAGFRAS